MTDKDKIFEYLNGGSQGSINFEGLDFEGLDLRGRLKGRLNY